MYTILNIPALINDIYEDSRKMYKVIGELEDIYRGYRGHDEGEYSSEQIELEEYLVSYIESMHVKICMIMEFYKLDQLYEQYLKEYNSYSKIKLKLYLEVDVLDSPVFGIMNKYIRAISFIENTVNDNSIIIQNGNSINNENSVNNDTKVSVAVTNKIDIDNLLVKLKEIKFVNNEKEIEFQVIVSDLENSIENDNKEESLVKKQFKRIKDFLCSTGGDYVKDELKSQIPNIIKILTELQ
ncbi:hypothetical protein [Solibacillus sp. FSL H8-0538]|uniref:hypothetical protein n=1 Tax=Solibacillus sp. FSL H8-0538 TaxID=2921400 RepID=UPI0030FC0AF1